MVPNLEIKWINLKISSRCYQGSKTTNVMVIEPLELLVEIMNSMVLDGAAGIFNRWKIVESGSVKDERRPSNSIKSIYHPSILEQAYHRLFMEDGR